jgi:RNA polymerase sigma factor (TIGR02999 family)
MDDVGKTPPGLSQGYSKASEHLFLLVYEELRRLAAQRLANEASGQTLQPTALVHEAYLRLTGRDGVEQIWDSQGHFFAAAAEAMRRILVENARRKQRVKRGGGQQRISLEEAESMMLSPSEDLIAIDEALVRLTDHDPVKAEVVKLRFFAGLKMSEIAQTLNISLATTERYWTYARTWLYAELSDVDLDDSAKKDELA